MLSSCIPYKLSLIHYYNHSIVQHPSKLLEDSDFLIISCFCDFLKPFYNATVKLFGVYYSTFVHSLNVLFEISLVFKKYVVLNI